jgi:hypothetical protein
VRSGCLHVGFRYGNGTIAFLGRLPISVSLRFCAILLGVREKFLFVPLMASDSRRMSRDDETSFRVRPGRARARDARTARPLSFMQEVQRAIASKVAIRAGCSGKDGGAGLAPAVKAGKGAGGLAGAAGSMPAAEVRGWRRRSRARTSGRSSGASASAAAGWW